MSQRLSSAIADEMRAGDDTKPAPAIKKKRGKAGML
jgi:hypothetical protein